MLLIPTGEPGQKLDVPSSKIHSKNVTLTSLLMLTINDVCMMLADVIAVVIVIASVLLFLHMLMNVIERVSMFTGEREICAQCNVMGIECMILVNLLAQSHVKTIIWLPRYV